MAVALEFAAVVAFAAIGFPADSAPVAEASVGAPESASSVAIAAPASIIGVDMVTTHLILRERTTEPATDAVSGAAAPPASDRASRRRAGDETVVGRASERAVRGRRGADAAARATPIGLAPGDGAVVRR